MDDAATGTEDAVHKLQKELFACRSAYATAQRSVVQLSGSLKDSQHEVEGLKRTLQRYNADAAELRACKLKAEELEGNLLAQQRESKLLQSGRAVLDEEIKVLRAEQAAKAYEVAALQQNAALQKRKMEEQSTNVLVLKNQVTELEEEVAAAESDANAAREALGGGMNPQERVDLVNQVERLTAENSDLLQRLQHMKADSNDLADRLKSPVATKQTTGIPQAATSTDVLPTDAAAALTDYMSPDVDNMSEEGLKTALRHCLRLQEQYKNARESLLSANRHESLQAERLRHDVDALASSLKEAEACSSAWQAQCMNALGQIERLKEMLSEGADWVGAESDPDGSIGAVLGRPETDDSVIPELPAATRPGTSSSTAFPKSPGAHCNRCSEMQRTALKHAEKAADLELQLRAICAELLRNTRMAGQIGRSTLPMLYSIESRLVELDSVS